jgi:hypothetical protein
VFVKPAAEKLPVLFAAGATIFIVSSVPLLLLHSAFFVFIPNTIRTTEAHAVIAHGQERHMHCALHIIGSMTDSWNMKRHYIDGTSSITCLCIDVIVDFKLLSHIEFLRDSALSECPAKRPHAALAEVCHILGCPELISGFAKIK